MADVDQSIANLERFLALVASAVSAVRTVEDHVERNGRAFDQLEQDAGGDGDAVNDLLQELGATLASEEAEAAAALTELVQTATDAQRSVTEADTKAEQAATGLDETADAAGATLEQASARVGAEGFERFQAALTEAGQALASSSQETSRALLDLETAVGGSESELKAAWDEGDAELDESTAQMTDAVTALEEAVQEDVEAFGNAADAFGDACGALVAEIDQVYDVLDAGVAEQGQAWEHAVDAAAREASAFADAARRRLEASASALGDEELSALREEYDSVAGVLDATAAPLGELEPLSAELVSARAVLVQIDELLGALS
ncbi:MAG: hypothetical protein ABW221_07335 [Vicinamibacteria bacterium]